MNRKLSLFREKRAISQIIGSLLVLLIVTTLCTMAYSWASSTVNNNQDNFNFILGNKQNAIKERFILEYVFFTDTALPPPDHKNVTVYVRNVGDNTLDVSAIYINGTLSTTVNPVLPQTLISDQTEKFSITLSSSWASNSTTHIVIVSEKGNRIEGYWQAP